MIPYRRFILIAIALAFSASAFASDDVATTSHLQWEPLPDLPDAIGVAGPFVGVHHDAMIVAGGANFPVPDGKNLWDVPKVWHDDVHVLVREGADGYKWISDFKLDRGRGYGTCVNTADGVLCIGGNDGKEVFADVFLLQWDADAQKVTQRALPSLPMVLPRRGSS